MLSTKLSKLEVVLVTPRDDTVEEPSFGYVYEIGVLVRLLELERLPDGMMFGSEQLESAMKIDARAHGATLTKTDHRRTRTRL
jgi:hypothetical protein